MITHIAGINNNIADAISRFQITSSSCQPSTRPHPCFTNPNLCQLQDQCQSSGVAPSTRRLYQSGLRSFYNFCEKYKIHPLPASSLTLQFFCVEVSSHVSYKTLKIYLSGIQLEHLEQGFGDPTDDEVLHLVCRGIRRLLVDNNCRTCCPITINLLRILKTRLSRSAAYTILE